MANDEQGGVLLATVKRIEIALGQSHITSCRLNLGAGCQLVRPLPTHGTVYGEKRKHEKETGVSMVSSFPLSGRWLWAVPVPGESIRLGLVDPGFA